jgi:uncharacterized iron-regulated membrane protein
MSSFPAASAAAPSRASSSDFYRSIWRWHFYAGLFVIPFLIVLAVTGALYLFRDELDAVIHSDLKRVEATAVQALPASQLIGSALAEHPGTATSIVFPVESAGTVEVQVTGSAGDKLSVYVDPYSGKTVGSLPQGGTAMGVIRKIHSLAFFGEIANAAMEIAAGWAILLVVTGTYLWWPRKEGGGVVSVRGKPRQRIWWRDVHAVTGASTGIFIVFLALSGMPWSIFWGAKVGGFVEANGLGVPPGVWSGAPKSDLKLADIGPSAWTVERTAIPASGAGHAPIGIDTAVATFHQLGLSPGFSVALPDGPEGVFTGSVFPDDVTLQRVVHLDRYSGRPLLDIGYSQYGNVGKAIEWGISVHMGQEFGLANQLIMLAACVAVLLLCVSAAVMWWKRRPEGRLGVPPLPQDRRKLRVAAALLGVGGLLFPLTGISFVVVVFGDWAVTAYRARA